MSLASLITPQISLGQVAQLCRRLSTSLEAGIDMRKVWAREAERARGFARGPMRRVHEGVSRGESLTEALRDTGDYFPELFRGVAEVGEQTGHQGEVFRQLAEHYDSQIHLRRVFRTAIAWPMIQLSLAILIIGLLIWIMGWIGETTGTQVDPLGFGLVGTPGLTIYVTFIGCAIATVFITIHAAKRGVFWIRPVQYLALQIPWLGSTLRTLALARLAWALHLTFSSGMDLRRGLALSLRSTHNAVYVDHIPQIDRVVVQGRTLYEAFSEAGGYPHDFLDTIAVGEQSGRLDESMAVLWRQYQDRARAAMATLTMLAGVAVWMMVAALIIVMIFRLFSFYLGALNDAAQGLT
ncbi:MAG: type II secretion system F family protein [Planctomycetota bacterium]